MATTPNPDPEFGIEPRTLAFVGPSLAIPTLLVAQVLTTPSALAIILGFVAAFTLPVVASVVVVRVMTSLLVKAGTTGGGQTVTRGQTNPTQIDLSDV